MLQDPRPKVYVGARDDDYKGKPLSAAQPEDVVSPALKLRVLIVDDAMDTRDVYQTFLRWLGHEVVVAEDGVAALQAVLYDRFDIIVLDLALPRITGWEVLQSLRREPRTRNVPVLVLSGHHERESALQAGADAYCEKPCLPAKLLIEVQRTIAGSMKKRS